MAARKVLPNTNSLGEIIRFQLEEYQDGKFRSDRNETLGFFDSMDKFASTNLQISLDHFQTLVLDYKRRILPYPHYSGIKLKVPENLENLDTISVESIPK